MPQEKNKKKKCVVETNKLGLLVKKLSIDQKKELGEKLEVSLRKIYRIIDYPLKLSTEQNVIIVRYLREVFDRDFAFEELVAPIRV